MAKIKKFCIAFLIICCYILFLFLGQYFYFKYRSRPQPGIDEFINTFESEKVYFDAIERKVGISPNNYFRDDGAVDDLDAHAKKLRLELSGFLPIEELDKITAGPVDFVDGLSFEINLGGKKFFIIFYKGKNKTAGQIFEAKVHEQTHALLHFGKIKQVKNFLKSKNISSDYSQEELFRLNGLNPDKKYELKVFKDMINNREAAHAEFLALKIQEYHRFKQLQTEAK